MFAALSQAGAAGDSTEKTGVHCSSKAGRGEMAQETGMGNGSGDGHGDGSGKDKGNGKEEPWNGNGEIDEQDGKGIFHKGLSKDPEGKAEECNGCWRMRHRRGTVVVQADHEWDRREGDKKTAAKRSPRSLRALARRASGSTW